MNAAIRDFVDSLMTTVWDAKKGEVVSKLSLRNVLDSLKPTMTVYVRCGRDCDGQFCWLSYPTMKQATRDNDPDYPHLSRIRLHFPISVRTLRWHYGDEDWFEARGRYIPVSYIEHYGKKLTQALRDLLLGDKIDWMPKPIRRAMGMGLVKLYIRFR